MIGVSCHDVSVLVLTRYLVAVPLSVAIIEG